MALKPELQVRHLPLFPVRKLSSGVERFRMGRRKAGSVHRTYFGECPGPFTVTKGLFRRGLDRQAGAIPNPMLK